MSENHTPAAIRLSLTNLVRKGLSIAKKNYPALSDPEILKLGLSKIVTEDITYRRERDEIRTTAADAVGYGYLTDREEDLYSPTDGKRVHFA